MDLQGLISLIVDFILTCLTVGILVWLYILSKIVTKLGNMAIEAVTAAEGLNKSTVIQRVVERYHPSPEVNTESDTVKEMNQLFDEFAQGNVPNTVDGKIYKPAPTDILPEDTV
jgi:hypothetical protein